MSLRSYIPAVIPVLFAVLFVSVVSSKLHHLSQHVQSLPFLYFVIYSPTLVFRDFLVIAGSRLLLNSPESRWQWIPCLVGTFLALAAWFAAAVQFGFWFETGAEVQWSAGDSFLRDPAAMKILMSGITSVSAAATIILLAAVVISTRLHSITGRWVQAVKDRCRLTVKEPRTLLPFAAPAVIDRPRSFPWIVPILAGSISLLFLELTRPSVPYDHLSRALPFTLLDAFHKPPSLEGCRPPPLPFPLAGKGGHPHHRPGPLGWAFGSDPPPPPPPGFLPPPGPVQRPSWLPENPPPGFHRWDASSSYHDSAYGTESGDCPGGASFQYYNPATDPLKITNTEDEIVESVKKAFKENSVEIKHIVLVTLESGRKELFPVQAGTMLYDAIVESHPENDRAKAMDLLSTMTPVAQMLTGERALDSQGKAADLSDATWQDSSEPGMGGINVKGALTASSLTLKSLLTSHCGMSPLPVDLLEEVNHEFYQPCLPQILELFNQHKEQQEDKSGSFLAHRWKSAFVQAATDAYDRQHQLNEAIGFNESITKETLSSPRSKHYPPSTGEINYFGYAESETKPYVRDLIFDAAKNNTRLFLSHLTTSTHHPWKTPATFQTKQYTGDEGSIEHGPLNDYLNTIRYVDDWLGDILGLLDEAGIGNSTLMVLLGDHGQAFSEDSKVTGTFENGHISNFHIPIVFRHPHIPRIDVSANVTALSIIPTILDLLVQTESLDEHDSTIASSLIPEFQGQSLIRPFRNERPDDGQPVWNIALINGGGSILAITSTTSSYRLILPLKNEFNFRFTNLAKDPGETRPLQAWTMNRLLSLVVEDHGKDAASWLEDAEKVGKWWVAEQKRIWDFRGG